MTDTLLHLRSGDAVLTMAPDTGGAIVGWHRRGLSVLRAPEPGAVAAGNVRGLGSYPLVPYSNRIAWSRFRIDGTDHALTPNFGDHPHAIHGIGWQSAWRVEQATSEMAVLSLDHRPEGEDAGRWPFALRAEQRIALTPDRLRIALSVENRDRRAMPAGLGLHPYFPRTPGATLRFRAGRLWENGPDHLPCRAVAVSPDRDHATGREVGAAALDNCFSGWDGRAVVTNAARGIEITIAASAVFGHLVVFTPPDRDFFAVEPVSHMTDAVNRLDTVAGHGLVILAPGETLAGEIELFLEEIR